MGLTLLTGVTTVSSYDWERGQGISGIFDGRNWEPFRNFGFEFVIALAGGDTVPIPTFESEEVSPLPDEPDTPDV
jgi:hypothetical protein